MTSTMELDDQDVQDLYDAIDLIAWNQGVPRRYRNAGMKSLEATKWKARLLAIKERLLKVEVNEF